MQTEAQRLHRPVAEKSSAARARSLPHRSSFVWSTIWSSLFFIGLFASVTCFVLFFVFPSPLATKALVGSIAFSGVMWFFSFLKRRETFCPLCRGTPLMNTGARAHSRAVRIPPLNHGVTAVLSILACQKFCCMFCGTSYDLLKPRLKKERADDVGLDQESLS